MHVKIHKNAKTTPAIRTEIQQSNLSAYAIVKNITYRGVLLKSGRTPVVFRIKATDLIFYKLT
jgi:hypothetical protein